jgi:hypothetical protein
LLAIARLTEDRQVTARRRISALAGPYRLLRRLGEAAWLADHGFSPEPGIAPLRDAAATEG